jgi:hypothetical protein
MFRVAVALYCVISPSNARALWHDLRLGRTLGRNAELVIAYPLEDDFGRALAEVREKLGIREPGVSGVRSSRPSRFVDWMYRNRKAA